MDQRPNKMQNTDTNICLLSHRSFTNFPRAQKQLESLSECERVSVVAIGIQMFSDEDETFRSRGATIRHVSLPVRFPMIGPLKIVNTIIAVVTLFRTAYEEDVDIYHCINVYALVVGSLLAWMESSQTTYDASEPNGLQIRIQFPGLLGKAMEWIVTTVEGRLAAGAAAVFTVNSNNGVPYDRLSRHNPNTVILENVPKLAEFEVDTDDVSPLTEYEDRDILIYVGGISVRKGGDMMINAMAHIVAEHPDTHLLIIGGGTDQYMRHLRERIEALGLSDHVTLPGPIDYDQVPAYLAEATIGYQLYQPDPWTSQSMASSTVFRHMGSELPLVVTDLPGIGSLVESLDCGLTAPVDDPEAIGNAVCRLLDDEELAAELAANGREHVEQRYNWDVESEKFLEQMPLPETTTVPS